MGLMKLRTIITFESTTIKMKKKREIKDMLSSGSFQFPLKATSGEEGNLQINDLKANDITIMF